MADQHTPDPNPNNEPSRSPLMFIVMAVIIVLGILAFFLLRSGGTGGGADTSPAKGHTSLRPTSPTPSNSIAAPFTSGRLLTSSVAGMAS